MKAIILAAGRGSRMGALTDTKPKCLTILDNKPLIEHQISALKKAGIAQIGIVTGYKKEFLQQYGDMHFHNHIWNETNMYYSLLCAKEWLSKENCIISYADIFYDCQIIEDLMLSEANTAIAYDPNWLTLWSKRFDNPLDDAETFQIDSQYKLTEIGNKSENIKEIHGQYMGILKISPDFWNINYDQNIKKCDMTKFLKYCIQNDHDIYCIRNNAPWGEIDTSSDLLLYTKK